MYILTDNYSILTLFNEGSTGDEDPAEEGIISDEAAEEVKEE